MYAANECDSGWILLQCGLFFLPSAALFFFSLFYTVTVITYRATTAKLLYSLPQKHIICYASSAGPMLKIPTANLLKSVSFHLKSVARSDYGFYLLIIVKWLKRKTRHLSSFAHHVSHSGSRVLRQEMQNSTYRQIYVTILKNNNTDKLLLSMECNSAKPLSLCNCLRLLKMYFQDKYQRKKQFANNVKNVLAI